MRFCGIDPSTKTGFVAIDTDGNVLVAEEIKGIGDVDPKRMRTMLVDIIGHVKTGDFVCIEGFGFNSIRSVHNGGVGWGLRMSLEAKGFNYHEVAPNALKKFVNVTDWKGEPGSKVRLKASEKKKAVMQSVLEHYGFTHKSDNVVDAYVLAQIARHIHEGAEALTDKPYQLEVVHTILNPPVKKRKKAK